MNTSIKLSGLLFVILTTGFSATAYSEQAVYGWELMSEQERIQHREKMRSFKTEQEREAYRKEHHIRMQERAHERGLSLPDTPRPMGQGRQGGSMGGNSGMGGGRK